MDTSSCLPAQACFSSPAFHCFCGIQTRSPLKAGHVTSICKIPDAVWLLMCLLTTGLCKDITFLACLFSFCLSKYTGSFISLSPTLLPAPPFSLQSEHPLCQWLCEKGKKVEVSFKVGWEFLLPIALLPVSPLAFICLPCILVTKHHL